MAKERIIPEHVQKAKLAGDTAALSRMAKKGAETKKRIIAEKNASEEARKERERQEFLATCREANYHVCPPCDEDDPMYKTYINSSQPL